MLLNHTDWEAAAKESLSTMAYGYYVSGANDEVTLRENRAAFERLPLYYRVLRDVSKRDLSLDLLGERLAMPIVAAPSAFHQLANPEGEVATAKALADVQSLMTLSTMSNRAVEKVVAATSAPVWFQLYIYKDRGITSAMLERVAAAGCKAIVFTVDAPLLGRRERDIRNQFCLPEGFAMENLLPHDYQNMARPHHGSGLAAYFSSLLDPSISWKDLRWICEQTKLPVLVKGIVHPDDAVRAVAEGAAGVVVSNHGGRQLDTAPATIEALPHVARAMVGLKNHQGNKPVLMMDGGIRRGTDVLKALALGAQAVMIGRPLLWGLSVNGREGVAQMFSQLRDELDLAMGLCGCRNLAEITADLLDPGSH